MTDERTSPMMRYFDEPEEFKNVKDVPAIFTVNNLNFTHGTTEECWCDQPMIERQEQFKCHIMWHIIYREFGGHALSASVSGTQ